jgi:feruloyl esterase
VLLLVYWCLPKPKSVILAKSRKIINKIYMLAINKRISLCDNPVGSFYRSKWALVFAFIFSSGTAGSQTPLRSFFPDARPICSCDSLRNISIPNSIVESAVLDSAGTSCWVTLTMNHPPADDRVKIFIALPLENWNGRFLGTGGSGYLGGAPNRLWRWVTQGFVAAGTNTGHDGGSGSFALNNQGELNQQVILDNAYVGIHDMTSVGKTFTEAFYGKLPQYNYFVGYSTGGRQGLTEAQRYPDDYDGIFSACPAINWQRFIPALIWPQMVMLEANNFMSQAKLQAVMAAAITNCDGNDGVVDSVIDNPVSCKYDPNALLGTKIGDERFTESDVEVVRKIWQGARGRNGQFFWYGLTRGTAFNVLAKTRGNPVSGEPFGIGLDWLKYFLIEDPKWDWRKLTRKEFDRLWRQSVKQYGEIYGPDDPDLRRFRDRGGKMIITHGLADEIIAPEGTIDYYRRMQKKMGDKKTTMFTRLFLAPGVDHDFRGAGSAPMGEFQALVRWVEEGQAPDRLIAEKRDSNRKLVRTRPLFPYPAVAKYKGSGSTDEAENFMSSIPVP